MWRVADTKPNSTTTYQDHQISCVDCGASFAWTAGEQDYYHRKGFTHAPKRCRTCRPIAQQRREARTTFTHRGES